MKNLFAPWRMKYIQNANKNNGCFICRALESENEEKTLVLYRGKYTIVLMNRYPYNPGHIMICPKKHVKYPYDLNLEESSELIEVLSKMVKVIEETLKPDGINIGVNIGKASGAGEEHLHFHIVPRWIGDTNFMPIFSETKVVPESLEDTYKKIKEGIEKYGNL